MSSPARRPPSAIFAAATAKFPWIFAVPLTFLPSYSFLLEVGAVLSSVRRKTNWIEKVRRRRVTYWGGSAQTVGLLSAGAGCEPTGRGASVRAPSPSTPLHIRFPLARLVTANRVERRAILRGIEIDALEALREKLRQRHPEVWCGYFLYLATENTAK